MVDIPLVVISSYDNSNNNVSRPLTWLTTLSCVIGHGTPCTCYKYLLYGGDSCSQSYRDAVYDAFLPTTLVFAFFLFYLTYITLKSVRINVRGSRPCQAKNWGHFYLAAALLFRCFGVFFSSQEGLLSLWNSVTFTRLFIDIIFMTITWCCLTCTIFYLIYHSYDAALTALPDAIARLRRIQQRAHYDASLAVAGSSPPQGGHNNNNGATTTGGGNGVAHIAGSSSSASTSHRFPVIHRTNVRPMSGTTPGGSPVAANATTPINAHNAADYHEHSQWYYDTQGEVHGTQPLAALIQIDRSRRVAPSRVASGVSGSVSRSTGGTAAATAAGGRTSNNGRHDTINATNNNNNGGGVTHPIASSSLIGAGGHMIASSPVAMVARASHERPLLSLDDDHSSGSSSPIASSPLISAVVNLNNAIVATAAMDAHHTNNNNASSTTSVAATSHDTSHTISMPSSKPQTVHHTHTHHHHHHDDEVINRLHQRAADQRRAARTNDINRTQVDHVRRSSQSGQWATPAADNNGTNTSLNPTAASISGGDIEESIVDRDRRRTERAIIVDTNQIMVHGTPASLQFLLTSSPPTMAAIRRQRRWLTAQLIIYQIISLALLIPFGITCSDNNYAATQICILVLWIWHAACFILITAQFAWIADRFSAIISTGAPSQLASDTFKDKTRQLTGSVFALTCSCSICRILYIWQPITTDPGWHWFIILSIARFLEMVTIAVLQWALAPVPSGSTAIAIARPFPHNASQQSMTAAYAAGTTVPLVSSLPFSSSSNRHHQYAASPPALLHVASSSSFAAAPAATMNDNTMGYTHGMRSNGNRTAASSAARRHNPSLMPGALRPLVNVASSASSSSSSEGSSGMTDGASCASSMGGHMTIAPAPSLPLSLSLPMVLAIPASSSVASLSSIPLLPLSSLPPIVPVYIPPLQLPLPHVSPRPPPLIPPPPAAAMPSLPLLLPPAPVPAAINSGDGDDRHDNGGIASLSCTIISGVVIPHLVFPSNPRPMYHAPPITPEPSSVHHHDDGDGHDSSHDHISDDGTTSTAAAAVLSYGGISSQPDGHMTISAATAAVAASLCVGHQRDTSRDTNSSDRSNSNNNGNGNNDDAKDDTS